MEKESPSLTPSRLDPCGIRPGDSIASYEVIGELGHGGMGIVYHCRHKATGESVAIKILCAPRSAEAAGLRLFVREASLMLQLKHPRIVEAREFGLHNNSPYLVMEHLSTIDLMATLAKQPREKAIRTASWTAVQVLNALAYAHSQNMVHRDVKPSNILAFRKNGRFFAKLADFGLAKRFQDAGFSSLSAEGEIRGTIVFMAPEQLRDSRFAKPSSDLYSLAASLYYMLCRNHHVELTARTSVFEAILRGERVPLRDRAPDIPLGLAEAIDRSLSVDVGTRFANADELRVALEPFSKKSNG
jgi:serine/threonine-protein kinase